MKHQFNKNQIKHHWRNVTTFSICLGLLTSVVAGGFGLSWHAQNEPADTSTSKPNPGAIKPITSASQDPTATGNPNTKGEDEPAGLPIAPRDIAPVEGSKSLKLTMKDLGDADGYDLNGVRTERRYDFTRPTGWKVLPSSNIQVSFEHSQALLPERSSLNILVNNRILKTVPLTLANVTANTLAIPIPPQILKDRNTVSFQVDQHYTYKCEDPYSSELWTKILDSTNLRIDYTPQPIQPDLARFPFPLYDPLGYGDTEITYVAPAGKLSNESLSALGVTSTKMGQHLSWHPLKTTLADASALQSDKNLIVIGTPSENSAIGQLASSLEVPLQGDKFLDKKTRTPLPDNDGVIQYIPNPSHPSKVILVISGNSPTGVSAAARLLAQNPTNQLLVGRSSIIEEQHVGPLHPYRAWDGFIQTSGTSFADLGLDTLTTRGFSSPPIYYSIRRMPDLYFPGQTKVVIKAIYSYSSQLDNDQSKLEVLLNHKAVKSVPLDDPKGKNLAELVIEVPSEEFNTFNDLEFKFHIFPIKHDLCRFVTDVHIWGTIHNSSTIEVPGEIKAALPDLGLLNDAGFPFTAYQDFTQVGIVLPDKPQTEDLALMTQLLSRLGKESKSKAGINLIVTKAGAESQATLDALKKDSHLIIIGDESKNSFFTELKSKTHLIISQDKAALEGPNQKLATIHHTPDQGIMEEMISPWNEKRVALLLFGQTDQALQRLGNLFQNDKLFGQIPSSVNLVMMNEEGPKGLQVIKKGEARFFNPADFGAEGGVPFWTLIVVGIFAFLGLISVIRFFFGR